MRLLPLKQVEETLLRKMTPLGSGEFEGTQLSSITNFPSSGAGGRSQRANAPSNAHSDIDSTSTAPPPKFREVAINSTAQWKGAFGRLVTTTAARVSIESGADIDFDDPNDPGVVLHACAEDISKLWADPTVKALLRTLKIRLEDMSGL